MKFKVHSFYKTVHVCFKIAFKVDYLNLLIIPMICIHFNSHSYVYHL